MIKEFIKKEKERLKLLKAFREAEICKIIRKNNQLIYHYPKIHSIKFKEKYAEYVFTIPIGISPSFADNPFVFRQTFGHNIEFKKAKNDKTFTLRVYKKDLPKKVLYTITGIEKELQKMRAPILFGVDRTDEMVIADLQKFPHLFVSGVTGGGKSQFIKQMLLTMIKVKQPSELQFVFADLKRADLPIFEDVEHVRTVAKDLNQLEIAMLEIETELDKRCDLLDKFKVSNINDILGDKLPTIVVILEEYTLCSESKEVERIAKKIANVGRAVAILLVVIIQRGSADNMPSSLKSQLSIRISFRQSDKVNAKVAGLEEAKDIALDERGRAIVEIEEKKFIQTMFIDDITLKKELKAFIRQKDRKPTTKENEQPEIIVEADIFGVIEDE